MLLVGKPLSYQLKNKGSKLACSFHEETIMLPCYDHVQTIVEEAASLCFLTGYLHFVLEDICKVSYMQVDITSK